MPAVSRTRSSAVVAAVLLAIASATAGEGGAPRGPELARAVDTALGGETFRRMGYLAFDLQVELDGRTLSGTSHRHDLLTGRHRVRWTDRERRLVDVLLDPGAGSDHVRRRGEPLEGDEAEALVQEARRRFHNDTYWLLMPFKLADPGVIVRAGGEETLEGGGTAAVLDLAFEPGTGLTPGDRFRVWIDTATLRVDRWSYRLEGRRVDRTAFWGGWVERSGVWFATERIFADDLRVLRFKSLTLLPTPPPGAFESREAALGDPGGAEGSPS